jgi:hypothetical protein
MCLRQHKKKYFLALSLCDFTFGKRDFVCTKQVPAMYRKQTRMYLQNICVPNWILGRWKHIAFLLN